MGRYISIFFFLIIFNLAFSYEVVVKDIKLLNLNPEYKIFIKNFLLTNFKNVKYIPSEKNLKNYKYELEFKVGMLSNSPFACVKIDTKGNFVNINCITSLSINRLPTAIKKLTEGIIEAKYQERKDIDLIIYTDTKNKLESINLFTDKIEVILYDKKVSTDEATDKKVKVLELYPQKRKYNLIYLDREDSLKVVKLIFSGYKIRNVYLKRIKNDSGNTEGK